MKDEQIKQLALDYISGNIFTDRDIKEEQKKKMIHMIFLPLIFLTPKDRKIMKKYSLIYEYISKAGPRAINGYPVFDSFHCLTKADHKKLDRWVKHLQTTITKTQLPQEKK